MIKYMTSESVGKGHPDKVCDAIADAVLDELIAGDPLTKAGVEVLATDKYVVVGGEINSQIQLSSERLEQIVMKTLEKIGYVRDGVVNPGVGIDPGYKVINAIKAQSCDIAQGVIDYTDPTKVFGAGDQGMMYGYATRDTQEYMPLPLKISHDIMEMLENVRNTTRDGILAPDGKCQVTVAYDADSLEPLYIDTIVVSNQTFTKDERVYEPYIRRLVESLLHVKYPRFSEGVSIKWFINPTGAFTIGGPLGDTGVTGRKLVVDSYGGFAPVGGGAQSGKDGSKTDRSAMYLARCLAVNIMEACKLHDCTVQLAYAIGVDQPVSIDIETRSHTITTWTKFPKIAQALIDSGIGRPQSIIERFGLQTPLFSSTVAYGQVGRNYPWDRTYSDIQDIINTALND